MCRPTSGSSQLIEFESAGAIIVRKPMGPSAREISSTARKTTSGPALVRPAERLHAAWSTFNQRSAGRQGLEQVQEASRT
jgi:hypothetical protein